MLTVRALRSLLLGLAFSACLPAHAFVELGFDDGAFFGDFSQIDHPSGVTFSVDPASFASYGTGFAFGAEFVQGAALELDPGAALTMTFSVPVGYLQFGALLNDTADFFSRASVALYTPVGAEALPFISTPAFSSLNERQFTYFGDGIDRVVITFATSFDSFDPLAIDNLVFQPVPEPSSYVLLAAGLLCLACVVRRLRGRTPIA
jgi:hypothetical protein